MRRSRAVVLVSPSDECQTNQQQTPRREAMQEMRQIKIKWLRPMHLFAEPSRKLPQDDVLRKLRNEKNTSTHPDKENEKRDQPWQPPGPPESRGLRPAPSPGKRHQARHQKRINDRPFDQHSGAEQQEQQQPIS